MKQFFLITILCGLSLGSLSAESLQLSSPALTDSAKTYPGLGSNGVSQLYGQGESTLWLGTGLGLSRTDNFGTSFESYYSMQDSIPRGGISAMDVRDSLIWIAGVFDTSTVVGDEIAGGGLAYSRDNGQNWVYIPQPIDSLGDTLQVWGGYPVHFLSIVTPVQNTTWDISIATGHVYITSWAGGLRRSVDFGRTWERIPLPADNQDFLKCGPVPYQINPRDPAQGGNHNHKGFSVLAYGDTVWVGTAGGLNLGIVDPNGCIGWRKFSAQNSAISGNWVVTIARQIWKGQETIWAATLPAESSSEYRAISKTTDGGLTWTTTLRNERANHFVFQDSIVYACTETGIYKSLDGENWAVYKPMQDPDRREYILSDNVYTAFIDNREGSRYLWIGSSDGIAKTTDDGLHWSVYRSAVPPGADGQPEIYAYPNPFAPNHHNVLNGDGHVRVRYHMPRPGNVRLEIYDFGMDRVYRSETESIPNSGDFNVIWDGRNNDNKLVANGSYFCKLVRSIDGNEESFWTKLIIIK